MRCLSVQFGKIVSLAQLRPLPRGWGFPNRFVSRAQDELRKVFGGCVCSFEW